MTTFASERIFASGLIQHEPPRAPAVTPKVLNCRTTHLIRACQHEAQLESALPAEVERYSFSVVQTPHSVQR